MIDKKNFIITSNSTARFALEVISKISIPNTAIFVVDENNKMIGSLADGDIRRGLIKGMSIDFSINKFMNHEFKYLKQGEDNIQKVKKLKQLDIRFVPLIDDDNTMIDIIDLDNYKSLLPLDAFLMAGGKGERLKPLTNDTPKPMLKIGDRPILARNIELLLSFGIQNYYVSVRHMAEKIEDGIRSYFSQNSKLNISFVKEELPLGTIGSISLVDQFMYDDILLMNSDLLTTIDLEDFYLKFKTSNSDMAIATVPYYVNVPYAIFEINEKHEILSFKEKPSYTYYSNAGIYLFKKELIKFIPKNSFFDATDFMEKLIELNKKIISYPILGYWLDIGRIEDYYKAQEDIKHIRF